MRYSKLCLVAAALLAGCENVDSTFVPVAPQASLAFAPAHETIVFAGPHPCDPAEFVILTGSLHEKFFAEFDPDGSVLIYYHANPQGVSGTGTSGDTYNGTGTVTMRTRVSADGAGSDQVINTFNIIGRSLASDFKLHETIKLVLNSSGEIVKIVDNSHASCR